MRKKLLCGLLTLAMCVGLLPMTAWAAPTPVSGDLDIYSAISSGTESGGDPDADGYSWTWSDSTKTLEITLKDCSIEKTGTPATGGNLILPDGCTITITLIGNNTIAGDIKLSQRVTGTAYSYTMTIQTNSTDTGSLVIDGGINGAGADGNRLIIKKKADVTAKEVNIGSSGGTNSYMEVDGEGSKLTLKEQTLIAGVFATDGGEIVAEKGLKLAKAENVPFPFSNQIVVSGTSKITLGSETGSAAALQTVNNAASVFGALGSPFNLFHNVISKNLLNDSEYTVETEGTSGSDYYVIKKGASAASYLELKKYFTIQVEGGSADRKPLVVRRFIFNLVPRLRGRNLITGK